VKEFLTATGLVDQAAIEALFLVLDETNLATGDVLFDYSDSMADKMYFLSQGQLAVYKKTGFQEKMQVIALLDPGTIVGEGGLLERHQRETRVTAIKESRLWCLTRTDFTAFQLQYPVSAGLFLEYILARVILRLEKTSGRLARIL